MRWGYKLWRARTHNDIQSHRPIGHRLVTIYLYPTLGAVCQQYTDTSPRCDKGGYLACTMTTLATNRMHSKQVDGLLCLVLKQVIWHRAGCGPGEVGL